VIHSQLIHGIIFISLQFSNSTLQYSAVLPILCLTFFSPLHYMVAQKQQARERKKTVNSHNKITASSVIHCVQKTAYYQHLQTRYIFICSCYVDIPVTGCTVHNDLIYWGQAIVMSTRISANRVVLW